MIQPQSATVKASSFSRWGRSPLLVMALMSLGGGMALTAITPAPVQAQSNCGVTLWSGLPRDYIFCYYLDYGGKARSWDHYHFYIPQSKLPKATKEITLVYPDYYNGELNLKEVEVIVDKKAQKIAAVEANRNEDNSVTITLEEPLTTNKQVEIVFSDVYNPDAGAIFEFKAKVQMVGGRLPVYIGSWLLSIDR